MSFIVSASFAETAWFRLGLLPALIFCSRLLDVPIGTLRLLFLSRQMRIVSAILGFFEVLIWMIAIRTIINQSAHPIHFIAYAAGFSVGSYIGMSIERQLAIGVKVFKIITKSLAIELVKTLRDEGYGVTVQKAEGGTGPVNIMNIVARRKEMAEICDIVEEKAPKAFYTIEDVQTVSGGVFPIRPRKRLRRILPARKGK